MKRIIQNTSELIITAADQYWWGSGWHSDYCCCQSSAAKYASVFVLHPQSTRGSHRYVRIALGHTDHSQETVRTFWASRQTNKMWLRQCCRRTSSCSIQTASTGVWRVSQLQPPACVWVSVCERCTSHCISSTCKLLNESCTRSVQRFEPVGVLTGFTTVEKIITKYLMVIVCPGGTCTRAWHVC